MISEGGLKPNASRDIPHPQKVAVPTTAADNRQNPSNLNASPQHCEYHLRDVDALDAEIKHQMGDFEKNLADGRYTEQYHREQMIN